MKLLVFAHTPPPVHGQSLMVETLVDGLAHDPNVQILHVNPRLSRDSRDIGRWRPGKGFSLLRACAQAWRLRITQGPAFFYYVPAPGKRSALYRDFVVMLLCRPLFSGLILHWHAAGLGAWLKQHASGLERWLAQRLLGGATLSIVLGENLRDDAAALHSRRISIVRNGITDPNPNPSPRPATPRTHREAVFLGLCSRDKGLFDAIAGVQLANARARAHGQLPMRLSVAGDFPDAATEAAFRQAIAAEDIAKSEEGSISPEDSVRQVGFVRGAEKTTLLQNADVLIFPTTYAHETQGLVVAEALAFDVPVITTRWRAVHEGLPEKHVYLVDPQRPDQIADALDAIHIAGSPGGTLRAHFLAHYTRERHLAALAEQLARISPAPRKRPFKK